MSSTNPVFVSQIDGVSCPTGQQEFPLVAPETGAIIGAIREAGIEGVHAAVASAKTALSLVRRSPVHQRIATASGVWRANTAIRPKAVTRLFDNTIITIATTVGITTSEPTNERE